jgi:hypothetical protein
VRYRTADVRYTAGRYMLSSTAGPGVYTVSRARDVSLDSCNACANVQLSETGCGVRQYSSGLVCPPAPACLLLHMPQQLLRCQAGCNLLLSNIVWPACHGMCVLAQALRVCLLLVRLAACCC